MLGQLIYILIIIVVLLFVISFITNIFVNVSERFENKSKLLEYLTPNTTASGGLTEQQDKSIKKIVQTAIQNAFDKQPLLPGEKGATGPQGVPGNTGPAGGTFVAKGRMISAAYPELVVDRMYGLGTNSKAYLGNYTFSPNQHWTLQTNGSYLENHLGVHQCLKQKGGEVFMGGCHPNQSSQWTYQDKDLSIRPTHTRSQCLTVGPKTGPPKRSTSVSVNKSSLKFPADAKLYTLYMTDCNNTAEQKWVFRG